MAPSNNTEINPSQITPPLEWPRAKAGNQTLEVKWDIFAQYILSTWGVNLRQVGIDFNSARVITPEVLNEDGTVKVAADIETKPGIMAAFVTLFAACVAHNYHKLGVEPPKPEHWAMTIEEDQVKGCAAAVREAMGKQQAEKERKARALAPLTPEPVAL